MFAHWARIWHSWLVRALGARGPEFNSWTSHPCFDFLAWLIWCACFDRELETKYMYQYFVCHKNIIVQSLQNPAPFKVFPYTLSEGLLRVQILWARYFSFLSSFSLCIWHFETWWQRQNAYLVYHDLLNKTLTQQVQDIHYSNQA